MPNLRLDEWINTQPPIVGKDPNRQGGDIEGANDTDRYMRTRILTPERNAAIQQRLAADLPGKVGPVTINAAYDTTGDPLGRQYGRVAVDGVMQDIGQFFALMSNPYVDSPGHFFAGAGPVQDLPYHWIPDPPVAVPVPVQPPAPTGGTMMGAPVTIAPTGFTEQDRVDLKACKRMLGTLLGQ